MPGDADIAAVASMLADRSRAAICQALLDGRFRTAGELAQAARVAPSTASEHLARLLAGSFVEVTRQGRHRYYRLAGPDVAAALEALGAIAPTSPVNSLGESRAGADLRVGRTCYDHLAGQLGVAVTEGLVRTGVLNTDLAVQDVAPLEAIGVALPQGSRRPLVRPCIDWTERCYHVAGAMPAAVTTAFFERGWITRVGRGRAVRITDRGRDELRWLIDESAAQQSA